MEIRTYAGAYAVIVRDDRMLLTHWIGVPEAGREPAWTLPGGGIEYGETPDEAVVREVHEETGYRIELGPVLRVDTDWDRLQGEPRHRIRILFSATVVGGELGVVEVDGSTDDVAWVPIPDIAGRPRVAMVDTALELVT